MKNSPLITILLAVLAISAVWSVVSFTLCVRYTHKLQALEGQVEAINYRRTAVQMLVNDTREYSKAHPAINPILKSIGVEEAAPAGAITNK
ncbi:MAG: hypothetical protein ABSF95_08590 [Verrucomicrobiota bacterium]|jgi:hypothetical protein